MHLKRLKHSFYGDYNNISDNLSVKKSITLRKIEIRIKIKFGRKFFNEF
jgi:hypothetical protein